jgi:F0F1-type ATP synthase membrane subunit b/b'
MHFDASFFVAVAFLLFIGLLIWKKVPGLIIAALDQRAAEIKAQLEEARQLRDEAQALLAQHQRKSPNRRNGKPRCWRRPPRNNWMLPWSVAFR